MHPLRWSIFPPLWVYIVVVLVGFYSGCRVAGLRSKAEAKPKVERNNLAVATSRQAAFDGAMH